MKKVLSIALLCSMVGSSVAIDLPSFCVNNYIPDSKLCAAALAAATLGLGHVTKGHVKRDSANKSTQDEIAKNMYTAMWLAAFNSALRGKNVDLVKVGISGLAGYASDKVADVVHPMLDSNVTFGGAAINKHSVNVLAQEAMNMLVDSLTEAPVKKGRR